ncbi:MAG TPA: hypothetical protein VFK37_09395 [Bacillales bacterium]|nr:hypothetical protein [Bacillales bacterium]
MSEDEKREAKETEKLAPGIKVSSRVGGEIANDREATEEEKKKGEYTQVVNLSND